MVVWSGLSKQLECDVLQLGTATRAPPAAQVLCPGLLSDLNKKLEHVSYLAGHQLSAEDEAMFDRLSVALAGRAMPASGFPHLMRWYRHVGHLTASSPGSGQVQSSAPCTARNEIVPGSDRPLNQFRLGPKFRICIRLTFVSGAWPILVVLIFTVIINSTEFEISFPCLLSLVCFHLFLLIFDETWLQLNMVKMNAMMHSLGCFCKNPYDRFFNRTIRVGLTWVMALALRLRSLHVFNRRCSCTDGSISLSSGSTQLDGSVDLESAGCGHHCL